MKITKEKFKKLKKYKTATFALWDPEDILNTKVIENHFSKLHTDIVILGLNPSKDITFLKNFRGGQFDEWYAEAFKIKPFIGAYMTDLISYPDPKSKNIISKWKKDNKFREKNICVLKQQFEILGVKYSALIVCLGKNTHELLCEANIRTGKVWYLKHPNSYRVTGGKKIFVHDARKLAKEIEGMQKTAKLVK